MHESEKWKWSFSVVSNSSRPHGLQPTRLLHPWEFSGKSTGVGCHCLLRFLTHWLLNPEGGSDTDLIPLSRLYIISVLIVIGGNCLVFSLFVIFWQQLIFNTYVSHSLVVMNSIFYFIISFFIVYWNIFIKLNLLMPEPLFCPPLCEHWGTVLSCCSVAKACPTLLRHPIDCIWRRQWHPTPVLLPGKSHGWRSLVGCNPWGR